jgi:hypothetical protein
MCRASHNASPHWSDVALDQPLDVWLARIIQALETLPVAAETRRRDWALCDLDHIGMARQIDQDESTDRRGARAGIRRWSGRMRIAARSDATVSAVAA